LKCNSLTTKTRPHQDLFAVGPADIVVTEERGLLESIAVESEPQRSRPRVILVSSMEQFQRLEGDCPSALLEITGVAHFRLIWWSLSSLSSFVRGFGETVAR